MPLQYHDETTKFLHAGEMPGLVRKLIVFAADDGLILQSVAQQRNQRASAAIHIEYVTHTVTPYLQEPVDSKEKLDSYGIIGIIQLSSAAYLVSISRRKQVAQLWNKPVYAVADVAIIPITSSTEARSAISRAILSASRDPDEEHAGEILGHDVHDDADNDTLGSLEETWLDQQVSTGDASTIQQSAAQNEPRIAEGVILKGGLYGRFAQNWFSNKGWTAGQRRNQGMSSQEDLPKASQPGHSKAASSFSSRAQALFQTRPNQAAPPEQDTKSITTALLPKLVQTTRLLLSSGTFFFAYDLDLTRALSPKSKAQTDLPLHKKVDPQYFWNAHISQKFIDCGQPDFVLPLLQGFVGQRAFSIGSISNDSDTQGTAIKDDSIALQNQPAFQEPSSTQNSDYVLTLISRRSIKRAGFRYLRRGIDEDGNVANNVETEQVLSTPAWSSDETFHSFVQIRGSVPLFFSQTPYTFKPVPLLHGSKEANEKVLERHFSELYKHYGEVQVASLVSRHGNEKAIGEAYEEFATALHHRKGFPNFHWFDFHDECRGMKFENVSLLIDTLSPFIKGSGWSSFTSDDSTALQSGIVRTNCMDCLDRTNVVQSAIAQHVLLKQLAVLSKSSNPMSTESGQIPNLPSISSLWADNGDAISLGYAGTSALKGDYVRTRQRNTLGVLNDFSLTLTRYYRNLFDDFFAQAALDYLLGNVSERVFEEFEANMATADPARDLNRVRQSAVVSSSDLVLQHNEDLLSGWVVSTPVHASDGTLKARLPPLTEIVLLLTDTALYRVDYDWDIEKPRGFVRIDLADITRLSWGTYITATQTASQRDPATNVGLLLRYAPLAGEPLARANTRTLDTSVEEHGEHSPAAHGVEHVTTNGTHELAVKIMARGSSLAAGAQGVGEREQARGICEEIGRAVARMDGSAAGVSEIVENDVLGVEDARRNTGYIETLEYRLKKMVWG